MESGAPFFKDIVARKDPDSGIEFLLAERLDAANRHAGVEFVNLSRLKIDPRVGVLEVVQKLPKRVQLGLISRFRILSRS